MTNYCSTCLNYIVSDPCDGCDGTEENHIYYEPDFVVRKGADLISRQAAIDVLEERLQANGYSNAGLVSELNRSIGYLRQLPSAQPERTGQWIRFKEYENGSYHIKCSECGQYWSVESHAKYFKYCFNCGADMRGKVKND